MMDFRRRPPAKDSDTATPLRPDALDDLERAGASLSASPAGAAPALSPCTRDTQGNPRRRLASMRRLSHRCREGADGGAVMSELLVRLEWFKALVLPHEAGACPRRKSICPPGL